MNQPGGLWERVRSDQDRARERAAYLVRAKSRRGESEDASWSRSRPPRGPFSLSRLVGGRPRTVTVASFAVAAACVLGTVLVRRHRTGSDLSFSVRGSDEPGRVGAWIAAPRGDALPLRFSDGTSFLLEAGSRARVSALDPIGGRVVLEQGRAEASVVHRASTHWLVDVGPFEVSVVGTRFAVSWDANGEVFALELREGSVSVVGPCLAEPRRVVQGQRLRVVCKAGQEELVEMQGDEHPSSAPGSASATGLGADLLPPTPATGDAHDVPASPLPPLVSNSVAARATSSARPRDPSRAPRSPGVLRSAGWRERVSTGRYREALELVEQSGFEEECRRGPGADLVDLGDVARLAGDSARARQAYLAARGKLAGGGRTAYGLGLSAFDEERDYALAARWFEIYLAEQPAGPLRREAAGRLIDAWQRAGERTKARDAAERYLRDYPDGTQSPLARQLTTR